MSGGGRRLQVAREGGDERAVIKEMRERKRKVERVGEREGGGTSGWRTRKE